MALSADFRRPLDTQDQSLCAYRFARGKTASHTVRHEVPYILG